MLKITDSNTNPSSSTHQTGTAFAIRLRNQVVQVVNAQDAVTLNLDQDSPRFSKANSYALPLKNIISHLNINDDGTYHHDGKQYIQDESGDNVYEVKSVPHQPNQRQVVNPQTGERRYFVERLAKEGTWHKLGVKGGGPKTPQKTAESLKREREVLTAKYQKYQNEFPKIQQKTQIAFNCYERERVAHRATLEKVLDETTRLYQEGLETIEKLQTDANRDEYYLPTINTLNALIHNTQMAQLPIGIDMNRLADESALKETQWLGLLKATGTVSLVDMQEEQNLLEEALNKYGLLLKGKMAEETYLAKLRNIPKKEATISLEHFTQQKDYHILLAIRISKTPILGRMILNCYAFQDNAIDHKDLFFDLLKASRSLKYSSSTHVALIKDPTLLSPAEREETLQSVIQQYEKSQTFYKATETVYSALVNKKYIHFLLNQLQDNINGAKDMLEELLKQQAEESPMATTTSSRPVSDKKIFHTKRGILIGREKPRTSHQQEPRIMEIMDPLSNQVFESFEKVSPETDEWKPVTRSPKARPTTDVKLLMQDAREKLENADPFIKVMKSQSTTQVSPIDIEEIIAQQAQRMQVRAEGLHNAVAGNSEAITLANGLKSKAVEMIEKARELRITMCKTQPPRMSSLEYLLDQKQVSIEKIGMRKQLGKKNQDWLQKYVINDETTGEPLWYAHFHYEKEKSAFDDIIINKQGKPAAHLKTKAQERMGSTMQIGQEQRGEKITHIIRSEINLAAAKRVFENIT